MSTQAEDRWLVVTFAGNTPAAAADICKEINDGSSEHGATAVNLSVETGVVRVTGHESVILRFFRVLPN